MATFLSSRGSPPLHGHCLNHRFREDEERFIKCSGVGESPESWGPETGVASPFTFKDLPSLNPPDQTQWTFVQLLALEGTRSFLNQK